MESRVPKRGRRLEPERALSRIGARLLRWWRHAGEVIPPPAGPEQPLAPPTPRFSEPMDQMFTLTARAMAPLAPTFTFLAVDWPTSAPPDRIFRSVLMMAVWDIDSVEVLASRLAADPTSRCFLGLSGDHPSPGATELSIGHARLIRNKNARDLVRAIIGQIRSAGLLGTAPFVENRLFVQAWTTEQAP